MIVERITTEGDARVPKAVLDALGLEPGDELRWEFEGNRAVLIGVPAGSDPFVNNLSTFTEWTSEADCEAFDDL